MQFSSVVGVISEGVPILNFSGISSAHNCVCVKVVICSRQVCQFVSTVGLLLAHWSQYNRGKTLSWNLVVLGLSFTSP